MRNSMFFVHNSSGDLDNRLQNLIIREGMKGYGIYSYLVNYLQKQPLMNAPLAVLDLISVEIHLRKQTLARIIEDFGLFVVDNGRFWATLLIRRYGKKNADFASNIPPVSNVNKLETESGSSVNKPEAGTQPNVKGDFNALCSSDLEVPSRGRAFSSSSSNQEERKEKEKKEPTDEPQTALQKRIAEHFDRENRAFSEQGNSAQEPVHFVNDRPLRPVKSFDDLVKEMLQNSTYLEMVAMHSGLGTDFFTYQDLIVKLFKEHACLFGKLEELISVGDVQAYFTNFLIPGSKNSRAVIKAIQAKRAGVVGVMPDGRLIGANGPLGAPAADNVDPYRFEYVVDGKRMYCGREVPVGAPPRPSNYAIWDEVKEQWTL
ncbi:MAG: DUF4373 domain-containing protein [Bacteroidia bacterium]|nr:DUF4373 domain-containing protein [Bacteroidia bacterium]